MIILHNKHSKKSRAFVDKHGEGNTVIDWYGDEAGREAYLAENDVQPSAFPYCVHENKGFRRPKSLKWVRDEPIRREARRLERIEAERILNEGE